MSKYLLNMVNSVNSDEKWKLLENLYDKNYNIANKVDKIPKIIHQIWLGSDLPERYKKYIEKCQKINPNWEYKLWTDSDIKKFSLKNEKLYYNINNLGAKSDILRYEILERIGGLYVDIDFDFVKPFDDLCYLDFFAGNGHVDIPEVFNSIMASTPNNKIISALVSELQKIDYFRDDINGVMNNTGPYFVTKVFFNNVTENDNVIIFPTKFFYAFPAVYRNSMDDSDALKNFMYSFLNENSYCFHLWHTNWQK